METYRVRTDVILAADDFVSRKLGEHATFPLIGLYNEVDSYLRFTKGAGYTDIELAFGLLVEVGRIRLVDICGTSAWARHCASKPLVFDRAIKCLSFADTPTFAQLLNAERNSWEAAESMAKAKRKVHETEQARRAAYDSVRLAAQASKPVAPSALG